MPADHSLDAGYFDGIFAGNDDPWSLGSSEYEANKFAHSTRAIADRRYIRALEVGCAHGVLTERIAPLCDDLLAIDIAARAIERAASRCRDLPQVRFETMAFPGEAPADAVDLLVLSEVVYYWNDADIARAARWIEGHVRTGGRILLVHWTGDTDYPQTGDGAVATLARELGAAMTVERSERTDRYRLDLWQHR